MEAQDSSNEDEVEKEVAYLAKNFHKFLKFKKDGKSFENGKFSNFKKDKKVFKKKDSKDSPPSQVFTCYECKGHGHVKKECPTYLKAKVKSLLLPLVTRTAPVWIQEKVVLEKETTPHLWLLQPWTLRKI